jgi:hypothetical protein
MTNLFPSARQESQQRNWTFIVGLIAVIAVVGAIILVTRHSGKTTQQVDPYVSKLQISNAKVSAAENYVGGTVTYLDATITNTGDKTLEAADMNLVFHNTLNVVVQKETMPLHVLVENQMGGYPDLVDMSRSPILPGHSKDVRMTLEHISADWNQVAPDMQLVNLKLR